MSKLKVDDDSEGVLFQSSVFGMYIGRCRRHRCLIGEFCTSVFESDPVTDSGSPFYLDRNLKTLKVTKRVCRSCLDEAYFKSVRQGRRMEQCTYVCFLSKPPRSLSLSPFVNFGLPVAVPGLQAGDAPIQHDEDVEEVYVPPPVIPLIDLVDDE